jgi:hypothetical protein
VELPSADVLAMLGPGGSEAITRLYEIASQPVRKSERTAISLDVVLHVLALRAKQRAVFRVRSCVSHQPLRAPPTLLPLSPLLPVPPHTIAAATQACLDDACSIGSMMEYWEGYIFGVLTNFGANLLASPSLTPERVVTVAAALRECVELAHLAVYQLYAACGNGGTLCVSEAKRAYCAGVTGCSAHAIAQKLAAVAVEVTSGGGSGGSGGDDCGCGPRHAFINKYISFALNQLASARGGGCGKLAVEVADAWVLYAWRSGDAADDVCKALNKTMLAVDEAVSEHDSPHVCACAACAGDCGADCVRAYVC